MAKLGKRTRAAREAFAGKENLSVEEAVALIKANAKTKFDGGKTLKKKNESRNLNDPYVIY